MGKDLVEIIDYFLNNVSNFYNNGGRASFDLSKDKIINDTLTKFNCEDIYKNFVEELYKLTSDFLTENRLFGMGNIDLKMIKESILEKINISSREAL